MKKSILILLSVVLISCTGGNKSGQDEPITDSNTSPIESGEQVDISDAQVAEPSQFNNQVSEGNF